MTTLWQDVRYGFRMLAKNRGFTAIALVTLAVGIGANTIMFTMSDLLLRPPTKVKEPEQLMYCAIQDALFPWFRYSAYLTLRNSGLVFSDCLAQGDDARPTTLVHGNSVGQVRAAYVSANYFSFLGVAPAQGRGFLPAEERQGSGPVMVLTHRTWRRLGADPNMVGQFLRVNGVSCQVVGIAPEGFTGATFIGPDLWLPLGSHLAVADLSRGRPPRADLGPDRDYPSVHLVGRLQPGLSRSAAQAQLQALVARFKREYPRQWKPNSSLALRPPGRFFIDADVEQEQLSATLFSLVLMGVSGVILLIACLNLANMLIIQGAARRREMAVRMALGGGRWRIIQQLLVESALLALLGGILGLVLAFWGTSILRAWIGSVQDAELRCFRPSLNVRVLVATLGFCLVATLLFGLRPAQWLSRCDIAGEMKDSAGGVLGSVRRRRRGLSMVGQIALAVALVLSASLLTRSAFQLMRPDPRFPLEDKLVVQIDPLSAGYDRVRSIQTCEALADRLSSLPQVKALGTSPRLFFGGGDVLSISECTPAAEDGGARRHLARWAAVTDVGRDYFAALEIPLLQGRRFNLRDGAPNAEKVTIIDESLARKLRPDGNALGCFVQYGGFGEYSDPYRVVGTVAHVPGVGDPEVHLQMYKPAQPDQLSPYLYVHVANRKAAGMLREQIAEEIHRIDARVPILSIETLARIRKADTSIWFARFGARLALAAGAAALFLAALGIYAIKGFMVVSRTPEIGIRKALGATHWDIMSMVFREGLVLTVVGLFFGLLLGLGVARVAASLLYGVSPIDPVSVVATVVLLALTAVLAGLIPARRAARIDPMAALRYE
ncbi:MAG: FtsX-like permease family protein [Phycisphaerae bacterium]|nr:FtsX-like permease family protein [Phycisphaerae bacterium]